LREIGYYVIEFPLHDYGITKILDNSDHVVVCSRSALEDLKTYNNLKLERTTVIYNGVDTPETERVDNESRYQNENQSIVFAGRPHFCPSLTRAFPVGASRRIPPEVISGWEHTAANTVVFPVPAGPIRTENLEALISARAFCFSSIARSSFGSLLDESIKGLRMLAQSAEIVCRLPERRSSGKL
jgi:hypothetical protein